MPGFDRTGPAGQGSRTGRGLGKCNPDNKRSGNQLDESENTGGFGNRFGRALGRFGFGKGQGRGPGKGQGRGGSSGRGRGQGQGRGNA